MKKIILVFFIIAYSTLSLASSSNNNIKALIYGYFNAVQKHDVYWIESHFNNFSNQKLKVYQATFASIKQKFHSIRIKRLNVYGNKAIADVKLNTTIVSLATHKSFNSNAETIFLLNTDNNGRWKIAKILTHQDYDIILKSLFAENYLPSDKKPIHNILSAKKEFNLSPLAEPWSKHWRVVYTIEAKNGQPAKIGRSDETFGWKELAKKIGDADPPKGAHKAVYYTHPASPTKPTILLGRYFVNSKEKSLMFRVAGNRNGDFVLEVKINNKEAFQRVVNGKRWYNFTIPLQRYYGKNINVEMLIKANGWYYEYAFIDEIRLVNTSYKNSYGFDVNTDRPGFTYKTLILPSSNAMLCFKKCQNDTKCKAWVFVKETNKNPAKCQLKYAISKAVLDPYTVSGVKKITATPNANGLYLGCFRDRGDPNGLNGRDLHAFGFNSSRMTPELCIRECARRGYRYAALQYSQSCLCDNNYGKYGRADNCNMRCRGNKTKICGGAWANSVYATGSYNNTNLGYPVGVEVNIDRRGADYKNFDLPYPDYRLCQQACNKETRCKAWTYVKPYTSQGATARCWLKYSVPKAIRANCCISGIKKIKKTTFSNGCKKEYRNFVSAYNRVTTLMSKGKGDTQKAKEAYGAYLIARDRYYSCKNKHQNGSSQSNSGTNHNNGYGNHNASSVGFSSHSVKGAMEQNTDRRGMDFRNFDLNRADPQLCKRACDRSPQCKAWTYVKPNTKQGPKPRCWLKYGIPNATPSPYCISGIKKDREWIHKGKYIGCFRDKEQRDLSGFFVSSSKMTIGKCLYICKNRGFRYAGLQYSSQCFCDNSYGRYGKADNCNMTCSGNSNEVCGGGWANSVFSVYSIINTTDTSNTTNTTYGIDRCGVYQNKNDYLNLRFPEYLNARNRNIYLTCSIYMIPKGSEIKTQWYYITPQKRYYIGKKVVRVKRSSRSDKYVNFRIENYKSWPKGNYLVVIKLNDRLVDTINFKMK